MDYYRSKWNSNPDKFINDILEMITEKNEDRFYLLLWLKQQQPKVYNYILPNIVKVGNWGEVINMCNVTNEYIHFITMKKAIDPEGDLAGSMSIIKNKMELSLINKTLKEDFSKMKEHKEVSGLVYWQLQLNKLGINDTEILLRYAKHNNRHPLECETNEENLIDPDAFTYSIIESKKKNLLK